KEILDRQEGLAGEDGEDEVKDAQDGEDEVRTEGELPELPVATEQIERNPKRAKVITDATATPASVITGACCACDKTHVALQWISVCGHMCCSLCMQRL